MVGYLNVNCTFWDDELNVDYLPTAVDCSNWLKLIVSEEATGVCIPTLLIDDNVELLFVVCERSKSVAVVDGESRRKFSKPGGGPKDCCRLSTIDGDEQQVKSVSWLRKTSSRVLFGVSWLGGLSALSNKTFDVADGVVEVIEERNKAAKSASLKLLFELFTVVISDEFISNVNEEK